MSPERPAQGVSPPDARAAPIMKTRPTWFANVAAESRWGPPRRGLNDAEVEPAERHHLRPARFQANWVPRSAKIAHQPVRTRRARGHRRSPGWCAARASMTSPSSHGRPKAAPRKRRTVSYARPLSQKVSISWKTNRIGCSAGTHRPGSPRRPSCPDAAKSASGSTARTVIPWSSRSTSRAAGDPEARKPPRYDAVLWRHRTRRPRAAHAERKSSACHLDLYINLRRSSCMTTDVPAQGQGHGDRFRHRPREH